MANFNQNTKLFIHENASEKIVCEMAAILSREDESITYDFSTFDLERGDRLNIMTTSHQYEDSNYKDKTVSQQLFLHNGNLERRALYWDGAHAITWTNNDVMN